jgi:hypothetical protein
MPYQSSSINSLANKMEKFHFDWSVNLGHVLTFLGFILTGFIAFQNLDKRVVVLEQSTLYQNKRDETQDQAMRDAKTEIREALRDVHSSLEKLSEKIDKRK